MPNIKFIKEKKTIEVPDGANLRDAAVRAGLEISSKVLIHNGRDHVNPPNLWERFRLIALPWNFLRKLSHSEPLRLSGDVQIHGDVEVETKPTINWHGDKFWE